MGLKDVIESLSVNSLESVLLTKVVNKLFCLEEKAVITSWKY